MENKTKLIHLAPCHMFLPPELTKVASFPYFVFSSILAFSFTASIQLYGVTFTYSCDLFPLPYWYLCLIDNISPIHLPDVLNWWYKYSKTNPYSISVGLPCVYDSSPWPSFTHCVYDSLPWPFLYSFALTSV